jgi:uncharacterized membrane protein YczE
MSSAATAARGTLAPRSGTWGAWVRLVAGLASFAAGLALMVESRLGLSSWDVLHDGIAEITALRFGWAIVVVSVVVVALSAFLGIRPDPGTLANMLLIGVFTDAFLRFGPLQAIQTAAPLTRTLCLVVGIAVIAFGTALYIGAGLGAGPRDSLMLALAKLLRTTPGIARTALELLVLFAGVLLGGEAGIGTLLFAFLIGPAIDVSFAALGMQERDTSPRTGFRRAAHTVLLWARSSQLRSREDVERGRHTGARV